MYYRVNGVPLVEGYDKDADDKGNNESKSAFPLWLLIVIIVAIVACGLWFLFCLRKKDGRQDFGFQFY